MTTFSAIALVTLSVALTVLYLVAKWNLFKKMGEAGWKSLIPVYSDYLLYKKAWCGKAFFASLLTAVAAEVMMQLAVLGSAVNPVLATIGFAFAVAAVVVDVKTLYKLAKAFGHGAGYTVGLIFAEPIFTMILGFDKSEYARA